ncbi:hypothetical protein [Oryza sativa Japonica Group]|uniref:Uncharacterized protein n=1 Tax=Oryza sativa subsp. japonica TaxID=39947 RepID=Q5JMF5_ORYSJ|nr:hypothetical protein [Oryza sativa Japonica Group]
MEEMEGARHLGYYENSGDELDAAAAAIAVELVAQREEQADRDVAPQRLLGRYQHVLAGRPGASSRVASRREIE